MLHCGLQTRGASPGEPGAGRNLGDGGLDKAKTRRRKAEEEKGSSPEVQLTMDLLRLRSLCKFTRPGVGHAYQEDHPQLLAVPRDRVGWTEQREQGAEERKPAP